MTPFQVGINSFAAVPIPSLCGTLVYGPRTAFQVARGIRDDATIVTSTGVVEITKGIWFSHKTHTIKLKICFEKKKENSGIT